jgi:hypothetical protein
VKPSSFGQATTVVSREPTKNGNLSEVYDGFDVVLNVRLPRRININGGVNVGRTVTDSCGLTQTNLQFGLANVPHTEDYCRVVPPWSASSQAKLSGAFPLPYQFQVAATFQDLPGIPQSNWTNVPSTGTQTTTGLATAPFTSAQVSGSLGRQLAAGSTATVSVPLIAPATQYEGRIRQLDFRFSRMFRIGRTRVEPQFDIYNALNASPVLAVNTNYGASFLRPTQILAGRMLKFGFQMTF